MDSRVSFLTDNEERGSRSIPFFDKFFPGGMDPAIILVEFEPQTLWYETSFALCALALKAGIGTEYHTFTHLPDEVFKKLNKLGVDIDRLGREGKFQIMDSHSASRRSPPPPDSPPPSYWLRSSTLKLSAWDTAIDDEITKFRRNFFAKTHGELHIDDNTSVLLEYNSEAEVIHHWRTRIIPLTREGKVVFVNSIMKGVGSDSFVKQFESLSDVIVDFRSEEINGQIEQYARVRMVRGKDYDSQWRRLRISSSGEVSVVGAQPHKEFEFVTEKSSNLFACLVDAFIEDYMVRGLFSEKSGWRTLGEIGRVTGISRRLLYAPRGGTGLAFSELVRRGLVEVRHSEGERGRGGRVIRVRIGFDKEPVKSFLYERVKKGPGKKTE